MTSKVRHAARQVLDSWERGNLALAVRQLQTALDSEPSHWDVNPDHPVDDWKDEVANNDTRLGYQDWVQNRLEWSDSDTVHVQAIASTAGLSYVDTEHGPLFVEGGRGPEELDDEPLEAVVAFPRTQQGPGCLVRTWRDVEDGVLHVSVSFHPGEPEKVYVSVHDEDVVVDPGSDVRPNQAQGG